MKTSGKNIHTHTHTPHTVFDMEPGDPSNISIFDACELTHAAPHSVCRNEFASANICCISVTRDTSQLDRSWLNKCA